MLVGEAAKLPLGCWVFNSLLLKSRYSNDFLSLGTRDVNFFVAAAYFQA